MVVLPWISLVAATFAPPGEAVPPEPTAELAPGQASAAGLPSEVPGQSSLLSTPMIQYGVAFTVEQVLAAGPLCVDPCILTSGGGISIRVGKRTAGPFYWGLAYALSKQGSNNIYRLGILQQARVEGRYYFETGRVTQPFVQVGAGVVGYGNQWGIDTSGPMASAGAGAQAQIARHVVVGVGLSYRALLLSSFVDSAGAARGGGVASVLGIDFQLEALDTWPWAQKRQ